MIVRREFGKLTEAKIMMIAKTGDRTLGIMFEHSREPKREKGEKGPKGSRITTCNLYEVNEHYVKKLATGTSACCPIDNFNKAQGRKLSLAYALKHAGVEKDEREKVWEAYRIATKSVKQQPPTPIAPLTVAETLQETIQ